VQGFEEIMRVRIAVVVSQCMQEVQREILENWLNLHGSKFDNFVKEICGWTIDGTTVKIPLNKENEARSTTVRENVKFEQFGRMIKRAYEQPA
jgi:translation initiation factor 3 subunit K